MKYIHTYFSFTIYNKENTEDLFYKHYSNKLVSTLRIS